MPFADPTSDEARESYWDGPGTVPGQAPESAAD